MKKLLLVCLGFAVSHSALAAVARLQVDTKTHVLTAEDGGTIIDATGVTLTLGGITISDASGVKTVVLGSTSGVMFGATGNKIGFLGAAPVARQTGNIFTALTAYGLVTSPSLTIANVTSLQTSLDAKANAATTINGHALGANVTVTKGDVGLGNADNTSDVNKPISTATQTALNLKADDSAIVHTSAFNTLGDARYPLLSGSYVNPAWITSIPFSKLTATPATLAGYGITDPVALTNIANTFPALQTFNSIASSSITASPIGNPATPTATPIGTHGVTTWSYKIVAKLSDGTPSAASAAGSTTIGDDVLDSTNKVSVTWAAVTGAASYDVYRTAVGVSPSTTGKIANVTTNSYVDAGAAGDSTTAPSTNATGNIAGHTASLTGSLTSVVSGDVPGFDFTGDVGAFARLFDTRTGGKHWRLQTGVSTIGDFGFYDQDDSLPAFVVSPGTGDTATVGIATAGDYRIGATSRGDVAVVFDGDSLTALNLYNQYMNGTDAPALTVGGPTITSYNVAHSGWSITQLLERSDRVSSLTHRESPLNVLVVMAGTNDFGNELHTPAEAYYAFQAYCRYFKNRGFRIIARTMISRGPAASGGMPTGANAGQTWDQLRNTFNGALRLGWRNFADALIDYDQLDPTVFGVDGGYANTTYYLTDQLHPTVAGSKRLAGFDAVAINAYLASFEQRDLVVNSLTASGTVTGATINSTGNVTATGNVVATGNVTATGTVTGSNLKATAIAAKAYNSAAISVANTTWTILNLNSELYDTDTIHSNSTLTERLTATTAGFYTVSANVSFASNATGMRYVAISRNAGAGTGFIAVEQRPAAVGDATAVTITTQCSLAAGDYVTLQAYQSSGGALNVDGFAGTGYSPVFSMVRNP